jgi:protoporphyrinogen oxidase
MAEVSVSPEKVVDVEAIAPRTVDLLCEIGVLDSAADVAWTGHVDVQYAYPVYTHERPGLLAEIKDWLRSRNIHTVGRFGDWEYVNSDRCVHKGLELGRSLRDSREQ